MEKIVSFFTTLSLIITYLLGIAGAGATGGYSLIKEDKINSALSLASSQGLCCDGEYFYTAGAIAALDFTGLAKYTLDMKPVGVNLNPIPRELTKKYGSDHIGGTDCCGGIIYASVEGRLDGEYKHNLVLLFDAATLEYTGTFYDVTVEGMTDGIPWVAVDPDNGLLYTSRFKDADRIYCFSLEDMSPAGEIILTETVNRIQGGSVYNGTLYLSYDVANSTTEQVLAVNLADGSVSVEFERQLPNYDNEAEDICVYPLPDGTLFHTLDYDKLLNAVVRHYADTHAVR